jgi:predicted amidophosphoribosyltransferase
VESGNNGKVTGTWQAVWQRLQQGLDLLFPQHCAICARSGHALCSACRASIRLLAPPYCQLCNRQLSTPGVCQQCQRWPLKLSGLRAVGTYEGTLRTCIHALKYDGQTRLAEPLGDLLASNADILLRRRATSAQVGLAARERLQNVAGAFICSPAFRGHVQRRVLSSMMSAPQARRWRHVANRYSPQARRRYGRWCWRDHCHRNCT